MAVSAHTPRGWSSPSRSAPLPAASPAPSCRSRPVLRRYQRADKAGLQIAIHAIGDRANRTILDFYQRLEKDNGPPIAACASSMPSTFCQPTIPRFAQLHVIASMQPYHAIDDGRWAEKRDRRGAHSSSYAFRSLLDSGAILAFGSDWPVAPLEPSWASMPL